MEYVEAEGNTIDEAIAAALKQLGVDREGAEIEILSNVSRGIFGIGARKARVRACLRRRLVLSEADLPPPGDENNAADPSSEKDSEDTRSPVLEDALEMAQQVVGEIARRIPLEVEVQLRPDGEVAVYGDRDGVLIGRHGQTLDALEYLLNRILGRETKVSRRVTLDVEDYRKRRRESLTALAGRVAERVRRRGKAVSLNPMSPRDRRIIHLALQDDPTLVTRSTGSGHYRRLVVAPTSVTVRGEASDDDGVSPMT